MTTETTKTTKRTDVHRPGAIIPSDYQQILDYVLPGAEPFDHWNVQEARALLESVGWHREGRLFGNLSKCGVCGAHFRNGSIYRHVPTGHLVTMGHDCADKYEMLADHSDWNAAKEAIEAQRARVIEARLNAETRTYLLAQHAGLAEAFEVKHHIIQDIKAQFDGSRVKYLTDKQIALVLKIAKDQNEKAARPPEVRAVAPTGRVKFAGILVSKKSQTTDFGTTIKGTIKVTTGAGVWLAWGTLPDSLWDHTHNDRPEVGDTIELTGTLSHGSDSGFAFFKRPTGAKIVERGPAHTLSQDSNVYAQENFRLRGWIQLNPIAEGKPARKVGDCRSKDLSNLICALAVARENTPQDARRWAAVVWVLGEMDGSHYTSKL